MDVEFIRFKATDLVELQGWLSDTDGDTAILHIHGMSGNGYENDFLDSLREQYAKLGMTYLAIDTRGRGVISWFQKAGSTEKVGSCYEIFEESAADIQGALDFLKSRGKTKFIIQGHSLGATKVVHYAVNNPSASVIGLILLAPTDMVGFARTDTRNEEYLQRARQLVNEGKPKELVGSACWLEETPLSAKTYLSLSEEGSAVDIYGEREGGALLGRVTQPMVLIHGDEDIGITEVDGTIDKWLERTNRIINKNAQTAVIAGASHGFKSHEVELSEIVTNFVKGLK